MSWKSRNLKSGLEPTAPKLADRKIALYRLSQILNYGTDGSLVNFRRKNFQSTQKTREDVDNEHSKECRSFDVDLPGRTLSRFGSGPCIRRPTAVQERSHLNTQLPNADTIDFFFWSEKEGGSSAPSEPPLATCLTDRSTFFCLINLLCYPSTW